MSSTKVYITVEGSPTGYGQHLITVERGNAVSVQTLGLTDGELAQVEHLIGAYRQSRRVTPVAEAVLGATFEDGTGRPGEPA